MDWTAFINHSLGSVLNTPIIFSFARLFFAARRNTTLLNRRRAELERIALEDTLDRRQIDLLLVYPLEQIPALKTKTRAAMCNPAQ
jgi:hypothetical protein